MKLTEAIEKLKEIKEVHGNLELLYNDDRGVGHMPLGYIEYTDDICTSWGDDIADLKEAVIIS